MTTVYTFLDL